MQVTHGLQVQANEYAIIVAVEWAVAKFHIHESGLSQESVLIVLCNTQLFSTPLLTECTSVFRWLSSVVASVLVATYGHLYIYIYMCVCVCVCVCKIFW